MRRPPCGLGLLAGRSSWPVAGERDEHVVERRPAQRDVLDHDSGVVEPRTASAITPERLRMAARTVWSSSAAGPRHLGKHGDRPLRMLLVLEVDLEPLASHAVLELVGRALGDHVSVVDHHDPIGTGPPRRGTGSSAARSCRPPRAPRSSPTAEPAARVEPGGGLVEEEDRRAEDERGREVEPAAHAARVRLHRPPGRLGQVEALEQLVARACAPPPAACGRAGRPSRGSRSRSGSRPRPRTGRRGRSSRAAPPRRARRRGRPRARSRVGLQQRGQDPHRGGLAGSVGAEQTEHAARPRREVHAAQRAHRAVRLLEALDDDRIGHAFEIKLAAQRGAQYELAPDGVAIAGRIPGSLVRVARSLLALAQKREAPPRELALHGLGPAACDREGAARQPHRGRGLRGGGERPGGPWQLPSRPPGRLRGS